MSMIRDLLKTKQLEAFDRLTKKRKKKRRKRKPKPGQVQITDSLARELMKHDSFYRGSKGAMRQKY